MRPRQALPSVGSRAFHLSVNDKGAGEGIRPLNGDADRRVDVDRREEVGLASRDACNMCVCVCVCVCQCVRVSSHPVHACQCVCMWSHPVACATVNNTPYPLYTVYAAYKNPEISGPRVWGFVMHNLRLR